ncbi:MAG: DEAD/DEAH box helicase [Oligoflexales bacterium]|nr:DEAD/DEAH box helicase [Oligoflexales bacterium]
MALGDEFELILHADKSFCLRGDLRKNPELRDLAYLFTAGSARGLLALMDRPFFCQSHPSFLYWYEFSSYFLREICSLHEASELDSLHPAEDKMSYFLLRLPPTQGSEYIDRSLLTQLWHELIQEINFHLQKQDLRSFIASRFPDWAEVGRLHFHLAEFHDEHKPFVFLASCATRVSDKVRLQHVPLGQVLKNSLSNLQAEASQVHLFHFLAPIQKASEKNIFIRELLTSKKIFSQLFFTHEEAYRFLNAISACEESGIVVKLPKNWQGRKPSRAKMSVDFQADKKESFVGFHNLLRFRVGVSIDGTKLSEADLHTILAGPQGLVRFQGRWVEINQEKLRELKEHWDRISSLRKEGLSIAEAMRFIAGADFSNKKLNPLSVENKESIDNEWCEFSCSEEIQSRLQRLKSPELIEEELHLSLQDLLRAKLRPYQYEGVKWLNLIYKLGMGACLADDMGLGKTVQMISLLLLAKQEDPSTASLLILPASLLGNWEDELSKFAPSLRIHTLHGSRLSKEEIENYNLDSSSSDVILTSYGLVSRLPFLKAHVWNVLVLDEAQAIKNPSTKVSQEVKTLKAHCRFALTGTPIENSVSDLWSIFDFACPSLLGQLKDFKDFYTDIKEQNSYEALRKLIAPYLLRRKKTDKKIIDDIPAKIELKTFCLLTQDQIQLYKETVQDLEKDLKSEQAGIKRKGLILNYLMKFKQICNHPSQALGEQIYESEKSGKFYRMREICETIISRGEKVLIFTQFRELTDILHNFLARLFARDGLVLHGGTPVAKRKELVDTFQKAQGPPFFILSLKAGGTGLNLTEASHVIHFDRWWNPAVENQATDRAFRIGQKKKVIVHKFICRGTVEEKIDLMIASKTNISSDLIEGIDSVKLTELSDQDLLNLLRLDLQSNLLS